MAAPVLVRELEPSEVAVFRAIRLDALRSDPDAFGQTLESALGMSDEEWAERLAGAADEGAVLVAEQEGRVVGMAATGLDRGSPGAAFLWGMFVAPDARGGGAGAALLRAAEEWARAHGLGAMNAMVAAPNRAALDFYRAIGYEVGPVTGVLRPGSTIPVHPISRRLGDE